MTIDRRSLLLTGTWGIAAMTVPGFAFGQTVGSLTGFTHGIASGEPSSHSVLLWTRFVGTGDDAHVRVEVSDSAAFTRILGGGATITGPWRDWTAKITVAGLRPETRLFYRFIAGDGTLSPVGRTRTLPQGPAARCGIAVFSCSNLPFGYFNAYAHAAAREDIDLVVHLGDYLYEYTRGGYAPPKGAVDGRWPAPEGELLHLADYRLRYASYRADPDLAALHAAKPWIVSWDDHESANDSWEGGAENHDPATEGDWLTRKAAAMQAWYEWMPVSEEPWKAYRIGTLATLWRTETRLLARSRQFSAAPALGSADRIGALKAFRDGAWQDPARTMMGSAQEAWLADEFARSVREGTRWQVLGTGTVMGEVLTPAVARDWLRPDAPKYTRRYVENAVTMGSVGLPGSLDGWGGYPVARARLLRSAQAAGANLIVLSGDSHNAWAFDLAEGGRPAGVEFGGHSVTSPGYEEALGADPRIVAEETVRTNPALKWCDTARRGYMALEITPDRVRNDWVFVDTILRRDPGASLGHRVEVRRGANRMT